MQNSIDLKVYHSMTVTRRKGSKTRENILENLRKKGARLEFFLMACQRNASRAYDDFVYFIFFLATVPL